MKSRLLVFIAFFILLAGVGSYVKKTYFTASTPNYIATSVRNGTVSETVLASGIIKPSKLVAVGAQVSGRITAVHVTLGQEVKQGDLIAEIDSVNEENDLKTAQASLANIRAQRAQKEAELKNAALALERQQSIFSQNAGSRADLESAEANVASLRAQIDAADAQIAAAQVAVDKARANLGYTRITAPIDGTVLAIVNQQGRTVNANQSAPTIVILGYLDTMTVRAQISEADIAKVKPGAKVYFNTLGDPSTQYEAKLAAIEPAPESITSDSAVTASSSTSSSASSASSAVYYIGVFNIDNHDRRFRTYMTVEARIVLAEAKDVLTIPASALSKPQKDGKYTVRVVGPDGQLQNRQIEVGVNNKTLVQVVSGLKEGERVVVGESNGSTGTGRRPRSPFGF